MRHGRTSRIDPFVDGRRAAGGRSPTLQVVAPGPFSPDSESRATVAAGHELSRLVTGEFCFLAAVGSDWRPTPAAGHELTRLVTGVRGAAASSPDTPGRAFRSARDRLSESGYDWGAPPFGPFGNGALPSRQGDRHTSIAE
jgi:hypothetical protein